MPVYDTLSVENYRDMGQGLGQRISRRMSSNF